MSNCVKFNWVRKEVGVDMFIGKMGVRNIDRIVMKSWLDRSLIVWWYRKREGFSFDFINFVEYVNEHKRSFYQGTSHFPQHSLSYFIWFGLSFSTHGMRFVVGVIAEGDVCIMFLVGWVCFREGWMTISFVAITLSVLFANVVLNIY